MRRRIFGGYGTAISVRVYRAGDARVASGEATSGPIEWKQRIKNSSRSALPDAHFAALGRIAVTLFYFPPEPMEGDVDNIVKPILDALCRHIYMDDKQVERVLVQKFEPGNLFRFDAPSAKLTEALSQEKPVLYVRISDNPFEELT